MMEEEDGVAYRRGSAMGNDTLALNYTQVSEAGSVDLVGRLKTLSSGRKKLMTKYFNLDDIESGPLLSEYFAVSLAFVALGAMIREANVRMRRKDKENNSDGVSPKLQRMALDSMLKSAMERLRGLAHRTQTLEDKVQDRSYMEAAFQFERLEFLKRISGLEATIAKHGEVEAGWRREKEDLIKRIADVDAQRGYFFKKMAEAESSLADLQRLRMEDGKANAKLVEIYASREQSWKAERIKMRHDIELLKELSKLQPPQSQMKSPRSYDAAAEASKMRNLKRRAKEMARDKVVSERELSVLVGALKSEVDSRSPKESPVPADDRKDSESAEMSATQSQEMEAELAIILKRVGALKRRGTSGSKLDELLNEAKGKPKIKRLGSLDQAPKGMVLDDTFLCRSEANNVKDVEVDEGAKDIWQAIEFQEGMNVQRRNGLRLPSEPSRMSVFDSTELIHEILTSPEKSPHGSPVRMNLLDSNLENPLTPERDIREQNFEGSPAVDHDKAPDVVAVNRAVRNEVETLNNLDEEGDWEVFVLPITPENKPNGQSTTSEELALDRTPDSSVAVNSGYLSPARNKIQPRNLDEGGWEEFILEKQHSIGEQRADSEGAYLDRVTSVNSYVASELIEPLSLDEGDWEEFVEEKPITTTTSSPESNISQRIISTFADHDEAVESVDSIWTVEPETTVNLDEGGWVESTESDRESEFKGYSTITCVEQPSSSDEEVSVGLTPVDDLVQFEEDIKSEIVVGKDKLEEPSSITTQGHQIETKDLAAIPDDSVEFVDSFKLAEEDVKSEIIVSNPISSSLTLGTGSDLIHVDDHMDQLNRTDISEGRNDEVVDELKRTDISEGRNDEVVDELKRTDISEGRNDEVMDELKRTDISEGRNDEVVDELKRTDVFDEVIDNGQSSPSPSSEHHHQIIQDDSNNSLVPDGASMANPEPKHLELNGGS